MPVDDFIAVDLCDVKGCHQPQCGGALEITILGGLQVRVCPCEFHYKTLFDMGPATAQPVTVR